MARDVLIKLAKVKYEERIIKAIKEKQHATYKGNPIPLRAVLSGEILHYRGNGKIYSKD